MAMSPSEAAAAGLGWVPENHPLYGTKGYVGYVDPASPSAPAAAPPPPPPAIPVGTAANTPSSGPSMAAPLPTLPGGGEAAYTPPSGPMTVPPPPPPVVPDRIAAPSLGPLVDNGGVATHDPTAAMPAPPAPSPSAAPGPVSTDPAAGPAAPPATINDAFKNALLAALNKPIGVDPNDPIIKGQEDAFSLAQTRASQRAREAMASRAGAMGQISDQAGSGAFDQGLSNLEQQQGESEANFNANLTGQELNKQRDDLYRYAALAGNTLDAEQNRALQQKLADLNAQIQREGMAQQGGQFGANLAEQQRQFDIANVLKQHGIDVQSAQFDKSLLEQGREADLDAAMKARGIDLQSELGQGDLSLRSMLGQGGLNLNLLQLLLGNQQFQQGEAGTNARFGAGLDSATLQALFGGLA